MSLPGGWGSSRAHQNQVRDGGGLAVSQPALASPPGWLSPGNQLSLSAQPGSIRKQLGGSESGQWPTALAMHTIHLAAPQWEEEEWGCGLGSSLLPWSWSAAKKKNPNHGNPSICRPEVFFFFSALQVLPVCLLHAGLQAERPSVHGLRPERVLKGSGTQTGGGQVSLLRARAGVCCSH